jgi:hypothetical protein
MVVVPVSGSVREVTWPSRLYWEVQVLPLASVIADRSPCPSYP